jgi:Chaperone of endosialidase
MPLTKAKTDIIDLNKDTTINTINIGLGGGQVQNNIRIGFDALKHNTIGAGNVAVGFTVMAANTEGVANTAVGNTAMISNTIGSNNTGIGANALGQNVVGVENTAVGSDALLSNTGNQNTAIGYASLGANTTANLNTAVGYVALGENVTGTVNTALGANALQFNTSGNSNTAVGAFVLLDNTTGVSNTAVGAGALIDNTTGIRNTAVGFNALSNNTTFTNAGGFGYDTQVTGSNQIRIGNTSITSVTCQTNAWSDGRDKADIRDTVLGLDFINELRPVDYKWDYREDYRTSPPDIVIKPLEPKENASDEEKQKYAEELAVYEAYVVVRDKWLEDSKLKNITHDGTHKRTRFHHGLIAQEIKAVIEKTGVDFGGFQDHTIDGGDEAMTIGYNELIGPLIKAVQELSAEVKTLKDKLKDQ